jgi:hypothetical protein
VLNRYALRFGWQPRLPVPIDAIVESYDLIILCEDVDEPDDVMILGSLEPWTGVVRLNQKHLDLFDSVIGPERFTLAHELGHWIYDAVDGRVQKSLFDEAEAPTVLCRSLGEDDATRVREINANAFASALLMLEALIRAAVTAPMSTSEFIAVASGWGVSRRALQIRLQKVGLGFCLPD